MSLLDSYRSTVNRYQSEISRLQSDRSRVAQDKARTMGQIANNKSWMSHTSSQSMVRTYASTIERLERDAARHDQKMADVERRISQAQQNLANAQKRLSDEEARENRRMEEEHQRHIRKMSASMQTTSLQIQHIEDEVAALRTDTNKIVVLFLASNPDDTDRLKLDEEARAIQEMIRKSEHRDSIRFVSRWAVRPMDVLQAINEESPTIVHFSGHGSPEGEIVLQSDDGSRKIITPEAIVAAIATAVDSVRLVFFNACFSSEQAKKVIAYVDAAIGMRKSIGDEAARIFASQFYSAIGFGKSLDNAFKQGKAALLMENIREEDTPMLYINPANPAAGEHPLITNVSSV